MTPRKRLLALVLLAGVVAVSSALAGRSDTGLTVTSTLDGKTVLPVRIQWIATPENAQNVSEVDYFIDGFHAWTEHKAPYYYGSDNNRLVTSFLKPGLMVLSRPKAQPGVGGGSSTYNRRVSRWPRIWRTSISLR